MGLDIGNKKVIIEKIKKVAVLTLSNGDMNLFDVEQVIQFRDALLELKKDRKVRALVIKGSGNRSFSAGFNIKAVDAIQFGEIYKDVGQEFMKLLYNYPIPKIALVHGYAIGIGCLVTFACDFRYCTKEVIFSLPEIKYNFMFPTHGGMTITTKVVRRPSDAKYILCTGEKIDASLADRMGLIDKLFETKDQMIEAGLEFAEKISTQHRHIMALILSSFEKCRSAGLNEGMAIENEAIDIVLEKARTRNDLIRQFQEKYLDKRYL